VPWDAHRGATDLANLLPLCSRHHHLVHEGGWRLSLDHERTLTIIRPDGELHATVPLAGLTEVA
jgi:predicted restriction endonuclease